MKKLFRLLGLVCILTTVNLSAQEITYGLKGGLNFASFGGDLSDETDGITSIYVGGLADFAFSDKFSVQPELLFSRQGASVDFFGLSLDIDLSYINLPIMAKYKITDNISASVGPQIGILLAAELQGNDVIDGYNCVDFSANIGGAYELDTGLFFEARYSLGLSDISNEDNVDDDDEPTVNAHVNNRVFQIGVGYRF